MKLLTSSKSLKIGIGDNESEDDDNLMDQEVVSVLELITAKSQELSEIEGSRAILEGKYN